MKRHILLTVLLSLFSILSFAQNGSGDVITGMNGAYLVTPDGQTSFSFNTTNMPNNFFLNGPNQGYGYFTNDKFFVISPQADYAVTISNNNQIDTHIWLFTYSNGINMITHGDGDDGISATLSAYQPYYVVVEGLYANGQINTNFTFSTVGDNRAAAINAGSFAQNFTYSNIRDSRLFTDQYRPGTRPSVNDIYYKFTLTNNMVVTLTHEGSTLDDTFMYLLNSSGSEIARNDDYSGEGHCTNTRHSYIKRSLSAGTYYVVSEGYSQSGIIKTNISGTVCPTGDSFSNSINAGSYSSQFTYTNTVNTNNYSDQYGEGGTYDVYHKFVLTTPMNVTLTHEGSTLNDTRMYLLNSSGNQIEENNDYSGEGHCSNIRHSFIQRHLDAGTYYAVSEGKSSNGVIKINITANTSSYGYSSIPSTYSTQSNSVGSMGGSFAVSPMGGATYSIPIEVPMGVGGLRPSIGIVYNSQSGYGLCGYGATLSGMSAITRGTKDIYYDGTTKGMNYLAGDALYLDGTRLILISGTPGQDGATYALESDPFARVIAHGTCSQTSDNTCYELIQSDGTVTWFGSSSTSCQKYTDANGRQKIRAWYVDRITQPTGNYLEYYYDVVNNYTYLILIAYGTNINNSYGGHLSNMVQFSYETSDGKSIYFDNQSGSLTKRLKTITCSTNGSTFRKYTLNYNNTSDGTNYKYSRLISVTESNGSNETLPATIFNWSYLPSLNYSAKSLTVNAPSTPSNVSLPFENQIYVSGDLNNDGLDDIAGLTCETTVNGSIKSFLNIYWAQRSGNNVTYSSGQLFQMPDLFNNTRFIQRERGDLHSFFNGSAIVDWDGNGYKEVMLPYYETITSQKYMSFYVQGCNASGQSCWNESVKCPLNTSNGTLYSIADLNNDGRDDIMVLEKSKYNGYYTCHLLSYDPTSSNYLKGANIQLSLPSAPTKVFLSDLNGNGVKDLLVICSSNYAVYWNQGGESINSSMFTDVNKKTGSELENWNMINSGDFNGDGLLDILTNGSGSNQWYLHLSNGDGSFTRILAFNLSLYEQTFTDRDDDKFHCDVFDFDGDGKDDIVVTKADYKYRHDITGSWGEFLKTYTYWMRSNGVSFEQVYYATSNSQNDALTNRYVVGDFNGDGLKELATYGYNCLNATNANSSPIWRTFKHNSYTANSGKVVSIVGDNGATTSITYSTLSDPNVYSIGGNDAYPAPRYTKPMNVVASTTQSNGAAGNYTTNYQYTGLKIHLIGKGALGFYSIRMNNTTMGSVVKTENLNWNNYYAPSTTKVVKTIGGLSSQIVTTSTFVNKGGKLFFSYPSQIAETDYDGNTVTTDNAYNTTYGYMLSKTVTYGTNMYTSESYSDYIMAGNRYQPQTVTETKRHPDDSAPFSRTTKFTYNSETGTVSKKIENYGTSKPLTTQFTYDLYGNVTSQVTTGSGVSAVTRYISYDNTRRFPVRIYTNPSTTVKKYTYNLWGNVLTERDSINSGINNTISNTYDAWGNKIRTQIPGNGEKAYSSGWGGDPAMSYFVLEQGTSTPWVKTWYDNQGREVKIETVGPMNVSVSTSISYNAKGLQTNVTENRGNLSISHTTSYDDRGRVASESRSGGNNKTYSYGSNGRSTTVSENGHQTTYIYDAMGNLKTVNSPLSSTLTHWYSSNGNIKKTVADGVTWTFGFDDRGNRTSMADPDAGTHTYVYDALGREIRHTDGRGCSYATNYDNMGRITYDGTTTFTYGTSGTGQTRLVSESNGQWIKNYTYDTYGHVTQESMVKYAVSIKTTGYHYNANGLITQKDYPSQKSINYSYDSYGNCTNINADNGLIVWNLVGYNGKTTTSSIKIGNSTPYIRTTQLDNYGYWQSRVMTLGNTTIQNDQYVFNAQTGNLSSRNLTGHPIESFYYDDLDRLTDASSAESYIEAYYETNGNYSEKTNVGEYYYPSGNAYAHAVDHIDVSPYTDDVPDFDQYMEYDYRSKADCIGTTVGDNYYWYTMEYAPNHQCVKSWLTINDDAVIEKFFWDEYEEINGIACLHWIEAPDGLVGLIVNECNGEYTDIYAYVAMTDHLGSLTGLLEYDGTFNFEASYDAWGKRSISYSNFGSLFGFRGYTGHEQIDEIGLVNMKGRMYDPLQGRFLSPDPYIQDPTNPQSFNRYSYCLNNPLKYTDPNGELFATVFGFISDMVDNVCRTFQGRSWKWTKTKNGWEIDKGWVTFDPNMSLGEKIWEGISRLTWQLPQTLMGYTTATVLNTTGHVEKVTHGYGATAIATDCLKKGTGFSLGCFIHGDDEMTASVDNPVFRHEYGHYLQSRDWGLLYLHKFALPSLWNAGDTSFGKNPDFYTEVDANKRAFRYFSKNVDGFTTNDNGTWRSKWDFRNFPISFDEKTNNAQSGMEGPWDTGLTRFKWYDVFVPFDVLGIVQYNVYTLTK